jgi:hypothetical protein
LNRIAWKYMGCALIANPTVRNERHPAQEAGCLSFVC